MGQCDFWNTGQLIAVDTAFMLYAFIDAHRNLGRQTVICRKISAQIAVENLESMTV
jgi:hypothetical protein